MASKFVNGILEKARLNAGRTLVMKSMQYVSGQQRVSSTTFMGVFGVVEILLAIQRLVLTEASSPQRPLTLKRNMGNYTWERPNANHTLRPALLISPSADRLCESCWASMVNIKTTGGKPPSAVPETTSSPLQGL
jgi:hypothetical protein